MARYSSRLIEQAKAWLGYNEADGSHKKIIDLYNSHKPLARGYAVQYTDAWCATFVSAVAIKVGYTDIIPTECGCQQMIELFKKLNSWQEDESVTPQQGWVIFYDWQDTSGNNNNTGYADHVGIVEKVENGVITVIEGNYSNSVKRRTLAVNAKYIRGYGVPKYGEVTTATTPVESTPEVKPVTQTTTTKNDSAKSFLKSVAGVYKVTASWLNVRSGAGTQKPIIISIPKDTIVNYYGYYTTYDGVDWLYVQFKYKGITYDGFVSSKYLTK